MLCYPNSSPRGSSLQDFLFPENPASLFPVLFFVGSQHLKVKTGQGEVDASAHGLPAVCFPWQLLFRLFPPPLQYLLVMEIQPAELQLSLHCLGRLTFLRQPQRCKFDGHTEGRKLCCWSCFFICLFVCFHSKYL